MKAMSGQLWRIEQNQITIILSNANTELINKDLEYWVNHAKIKPIFKWGKV